MDFLIGILGNLIASQIYESLPKASAWLVARAAVRLVTDTRNRYSEEWSAHLEHCEGNLVKIIHAVGCVKASFIMQPLSLRAQTYLCHFLNTRWNTCFIVVWTKRYIPTHHPKTPLEYVVYYKDIVILELPYIVARRISLALCPEVSHFLDVFNAKWMQEMILDPQEFTLVPPVHLLPYWDKVTLREGE